MLYYALLFLVIGLVAAIVVFGGMTGAAAGIAQLLIFLFLAFVVVSSIVGIMRRTS